jgi:hypothetical protein
MLVFAAVINILMWVILAANMIYVRARSRPRALTPDARPTVTIAIPARNEGPNLMRLLPSLLAQDYPVESIVVYDDGSEDDTADVVRQQDDRRITLLRGDGPPPGWIGKPHALFQATRRLRTDLIVFLDADVTLRKKSSLAALIDRYRLLPPGSVMTALLRARGGGLLLVSNITMALMAALPWPAARWTRIPWLGGLNGQCWILDTATYGRLEPHRHARAMILEDVEIGRYLLSNGVIPELVDARDDLEVTMYRTFTEAWLGFRKNVFLIFTGRTIPFLLLFGAFTIAFLAAPLLCPALLASVWLLKFTTDRIGRFPLWVSLAAPASWVLGAVLLADSALAHWSGRVSWKGRSVSGVSNSEPKSDVLA